ncbi:hypothetical protein QO004_005950 [Rhizobium mesoamericanum]|nr:hypothetical protein [Rhizobium mesoamericanum]
MQSRAFLNQLTYSEIKKRSGTVGVSLPKNVLGQLTPASVISFIWLVIVSVVAW